MEEKKITETKAFKVGAVIVAILILIAIFDIVNKSGENIGPNTSNQSQEITALEDTSPTPTPTPTPTSTAPRTSFSDGIYEVGVDIEPGIYKSSPENDGLCYYARLNSLTSDDKIIDNGNSKGQIIVEVLASDVAFETSGCSWTKQVR